MDESEAGGRREPTAAQQPIIMAATNTSIYSALGMDISASHVLTHVDVPTALGIGPSILFYMWRVRPRLLEAYSPATTSPQYC